MQIDYITNTSEGLNIGSKNQALGVTEALAGVGKRIAGSTSPTLQEYDLSNVASKLAPILAQGGESHIVIGVGDDGVKAFEQLPRLPGHIYVLIGHEIPKNIANVKDKIDLLAIPEHVGHRKELDGMEIVRTRGVAHTMTADKAQSAFAEWKGKLASADKPIVAVMLGGEVEGKSYTPEEAYKLGVYAAAKAREVGGDVLATNSPRASMETINAFNKAIGDQQVNGAFFNFMQNKDEIPFQALIGAVKANPKSLVVATGDSVSMPSEAGSVVDASQLRLFPVSNQNVENTAFVEWMVSAGRAQYTGQAAPDAVTNPLPLDAGYQIALAINKQLAKTKIVTMAQNLGQGNSLFAGAVRA